MRRTRKEYFEDLYNIDTQEQVAVPICGFDGIRRFNYFGGEPIRRAEVEVRVGKLKNGKTAGGDDRVVDWIWRLCNMSFERGIVSEDCRYVVIVSLYKGKKKREMNIRIKSGISVAGQMYAGILIDKVRSVTGGLIDDEQGGFREGNGRVDQIFTLKQKEEKAYDRANRKGLWEVLRMYNVGVNCWVELRVILLLLFGEYLAAGITPGAISLRVTKPR